MRCFWRALGLFGLVLWLETGLPVMIIDVGASRGGVNDVAYTYVRQDQGACMLGLHLPCLSAAITHVPGRWPSAVARRRAWSNTSMLALGDSVNGLHARRLET